ncbi:MAG: TonB-dependent receptor [Bacteroidota bacterium]
MMCSCFWLKAVGQERAQTYGIDSVIITGQYTPQTAEKAIHAIRTISSEKINRMAAVNLGDVLSNELNIRLSQDNILGQSLSIQGLSGENVKILIDGVPVIGRQNGNIDLGQLNLLGIERIEIVEGPLSVNYGTQALAGTINLITKKPRKAGVSVQADVYGEQRGTINTQALIQMKQKRHSGSFSLARNFFDGWHHTEGAWPSLDQRVADAMRFQSWKPRTQLFGRLQYHYALPALKLSYRLSLFDEMILNRGLPRLPYQEIAFDDTYHTQRMDHSVSAVGKLGDNMRINGVAGYNLFRRQSNTYRKDLTTLEQELLDVAGEQDTTGFELWMSRSSFIIPKVKENLAVEVGYDVSQEIAQGQRIENRIQSLGDYALFATAEWKPVSWLQLRPGVRMAYNTAYEAPVVPSLNAKAAWGDWVLRASYARGFRAPSLKELYFYFVDINHNIVGNPDLKAEYSHSYALNLRYKKLTAGQKLWRFEWSSFYNDLQNRITLAEINSPQFTYVNIGKFQSIGSSLKASLRTTRITSQIGLNYIGRYNQLSVEDDIPTFSFTPEVTGNVSYHWSNATSISLFYKYQGKLPGFRVDPDGALQASFIQAYQLLDLTLQRSFWNDRLGVSLGAKNLFNITNIAAQLATGVHSGNTRQVAVGTGRNLFFKLTYQLSPSTFNASLR